MHDQGGEVGRGEDVGLRDDRRVAHQRLFGAPGTLGAQQGEAVPVPGVRQGPYRRVVDAVVALVHGAAQQLGGGPRRRQDLGGGHPAVRVGRRLRRERHRQLGEPREPGQHPYRQVGQPGAREDPDADLAERPQGRTGLLHRVGGPRGDRADPRQLGDPCMVFRGPPERIPAIAPGPVGRRHQRAQRRVGVSPHGVRADQLFRHLAEHLRGGGSARAPATPPAVEHRPQPGEALVGEVVLEEPGGGEPGGRESWGGESVLGVLVHGRRGRSCSCALRLCRSVLWLLSYTPFGGESRPASVARTTTIPA